MNKKAQTGTGLDVFLSVIAMIFVIGIIIMAFILVGTGMMESDTAFSRTGAIALNNESHYMNSTIGSFVLNDTLRSVRCSVSTIYNGTELMTASNYTITNCLVTEVGSSFANETWNVSYTYTYEAPNDASRVINATTLSIAGASDWFGIFIVISAVVVLILLIVMIVISLRQGGLMGGQGGA